MFEEDQKQRQYYDTVREEFAREGPATSFVQWFCRLLTYITLFGITVNYSKRDGSPYRLEVRLTPSWIPWGIQLHHFFRSDQEPEYHNHPWGIGYSFILIHGYGEHYLEPDTRRRLSRPVTPRTWNTLYNKRERRTWHRVQLFSHLDRGVVAELRPWTLFFHGRRFAEKDGVSSWGFFNVDTLRYTGWREFVNRPAEPEIHVEVDPDPTPMFGTATSGVPDTFDTDNCPTTPIPKEIFKEVHDASVRTGLSGEPQPGACSSDQESTS